MTGKRHPALHGVEGLLRYWSGAAEVAGRMRTGPPSPLSSCCTGRTRLSRELMFRGAECVAAHSSTICAPLPPPPLLSAARPLTAKGMGVLSTERQAEKSRYMSSARSNHFMSLSHGNREAAALSKAAAMWTGKHARVHVRMHTSPAAPSPAAGQQAPPSQHAPAAAQSLTSLHVAGAPASAPAAGSTAAGQAMP